MKLYYEHDGITIYHGDCREIIPQIAPGSVNCIVTSPPYNQMDGIAKGKLSGLWAESHGGAGFSRRWKEAGYPDSMDEAEYQAWQNELFTSVAAACADNASLFYNHQIRWRDGVCLHPVNWFTPPRMAFAAGNCMGSARWHDV